MFFPLELNQDFAPKFFCEGIVFLVVLQNFKQCLLNRGSNISSDFSLLLLFTLLIIVLLIVMGKERKAANVLRDNVFSQVYMVSDDPPIIKQNLEDLNKGAGDRKWFN